MIRELIKDRLFVADREGCTAKRHQHGPRASCIVHATKSCHCAKVGQLSPTDKRYLGFIEQGDMWLNLIDASSAYFQTQSFTMFLKFARENWLDERPIRIHCDQGRSRSVMLALLFMAKVLELIPNTSLDDAMDAFEAQHGKMLPSEGIETYLRAHWHSIEAVPVNYRGPNRRSQQYRPPDTSKVTTDEAIALVVGSPIVHFATMVEIENKEHKMVVPVPNILQMRINEAYEWCIANGIAPRLQTLKPRQKGSSTFCGHIFYHHARRFHTDGLIIGDESSRVMKVWQIFTEYSDRDKFPWDSKFYYDTKKAFFTYGDGTKGQWEYDTANDPKAGISGTRQAIWYTEAARYPKMGSRTDVKVITASLASLSKGPHSIAVMESTAEGACYDAKTEILTDQGWKFFKKLDGSEQILTKDRKTNVAYYEQFWQKQVHAYRGPMIRMKARSVDLRVTPNHNVWCARQKGKMKMQTARAMLTTSTDFNFDRAMTWIADGVKDFRLPSYAHVQGAGHRVIPEKIIPISVWLRFLGHWLSDGHVTFVHCNRSVTLTQVKFIEEFRRSAHDLASAIGCKVRDVPHGNGRRFTLCNAQLAAYLVNFARPKRIPRDLLMSMTSEQCRDLMAAIYCGDGDQEKLHKSDTCIQGKIYCGIDRELQDDVQELALKCGYATSAHGPKRNRIATFTEQVTASLKCGNPPTEEPNCAEDVYCVTLPRDHLLMVRRHGNAIWCGNSGFFYTNWQGAVSLEDMKGGKFGNGWIKIFAAWFEFEDAALPRHPQYAEHFHENFSYREKRGRQLYGWTPEQIAWRRFTIASECDGDESIFDQDYPENDRDCFLQSGRPRFDDDGVTRLEIMADREHDLAERGILSGSEMNIIFTPQKEDAWLWLKEKPIRGCAYIVAVDPCQGSQSNGSKNPDCHGVVVIRQPYFDDKNVLRPVAVVAVIDVLPSGCRFDDSLIAEKIVMLANYFGGCLVVPETGNGLGVLVKLQDFGANIYRRMKPDSFIPGKMLPTLGWDTNSQTRDIVVGAIADAIREGNFECAYKPAVSEMRTFVVTDRGRAEAAPGKHDDLVMAIGIGLATLKLASVYSPIRPRSPFDHERKKPSVFS